MWSEAAWLQCSGRGIASILGSPLPCTVCGGQGDGTTMNTGAIKAAFTAASEAASPAAPATVLVASGTYLSGQVVLLSNIILYVAEDATLLASANATDYP